MDGDLTAGRALPLDGVRVPTAFLALNPNKRSIAVDLRDAGFGSAEDAALERAGTAGARAR